MLSGVAVPQVSESKGSTGAEDDEGGEPREGEVGGPSPGVKEVGLRAGEGRRGQARGDGGGEGLRRGRRRRGSGAEQVAFELRVSERGRVRGGHGGGGQGGGERRERRGD